MKKNLEKFFWFFGSAKFAVLVIVALAVISAMGTFVESRYNLEFAQSLVYNTWYLKSAMLALSASLIISALERWPWQFKHIPFLVAHIGLLFIVFGSWQTQEFGIDGSIQLPVGQSNKWVSLTQKDVIVYASSDGMSFSPLFNQDVNFIKNPPKESPLHIKAHDLEFEIFDFFPFAIRDTKVIESKKADANAAIRFQIQNENVNLSQWLLESKRNPAVLDLGPAKVVFSGDAYEHKAGESVLHIGKAKQNEAVPLTVYYKDNRPPLKAKIKAGEKLALGWMGLEFRLLKYLEKAEESNEYKMRDRPSDITNEVLHVKFNNVEHKVELNQPTKFFTDNTVYVLSYGNRQIPLNFDIFLEEFKMETYPGTMRPASYASMVSIKDFGKHLISMNEPLKYNSFTFYQASFVSDPNTGKPVASILSVNYDPGRFMKYFGSLIVVLGSILLFYFKRYYAKLAKRNS